MNTSTREQDVAAARHLLTDERLLTFLRSVRDSGHVFAVKLINADLDEGQDLDSIFYTGEEYGFSLSVKQISEAEFQISFGCQAGPAAGDGGRWLVSFDGDAVRSVALKLRWIS